MPEIINLLTGNIGQLQCDAGCQLNIQGSIIFHDSESNNFLVTLGDVAEPSDLAATVGSERLGQTRIMGSLGELCSTVNFLLVRRARLALSIALDAAKSVNASMYMHDCWRFFTAPVMAAVGVALSRGQTYFPLDPQPLKKGTFGDPRDPYRSTIGAIQEIVWASMLHAWTVGEGVGSFENDLIEYVDRTTFIGDPSRFISIIDQLPRPESGEIAVRGAFYRELLRATLYDRIGQPNPDAYRCASIWLMWAVRMRLREGVESADISDVRISTDRLHRIFGPDIVRRAGAELFKAHMRGDLGEWSARNVDRLGDSIFQVLIDYGFGDQANSIIDGLRLDVPIDQLAEVVIKEVDRLSPVRLIKGFSQALVEHRRVDDLKRIVDRMVTTFPSDSTSITLWYYFMLLRMGMPQRLIREIGHTPRLIEEGFPTPARSDLLALRCNAMRTIGRHADALALLESAPREVLDEPTRRQGHRIERARLTRDLGSPVAALAQLEGILAETDDAEVPVYESLMAIFLRFGRYWEAAKWGRMAYNKTLQTQREMYPFGRFAAVVMLCLAYMGHKVDPDDDIVLTAMGVDQPPDMQRDLIAVTAMLINGLAEATTGGREFVDRIQAGTESILEQAIAEHDHSLAMRALYVRALHDQTFRPKDALDSWLRFASVLKSEFDATSHDGHLYLATNLIYRNQLKPARNLLKELLGSSLALGRDSTLQVAMLVDSHTVREIDLVTAAMFDRPGVNASDLRLVGELRRGPAGRALLRSANLPKWQKHGLDDEVIADIAPHRGSIGVLEWLTDGTSARAIVTTVSATGFVASCTVPLPDVDLGRLSTRMRSRLSGWRTGRAGDPFDIAEWHTCQNWLKRVLEAHFSPEDHLVVIPFAEWRQLPWHVAVFDHVTCSYEPSWVALLATVAGDRQQTYSREGVVSVPRVGDPPEIVSAMARYVASCDERAYVLEGVSADRRSVEKLLDTVDLASLLTHGYSSAEESEIALMLAADGALPLAHSVAAASLRGRAHRFGWREYATLSNAPRTILSAACSTGSSHIVGLGEPLGIYNVLRHVGLQTFVSPQWDIVASDVLPILAKIRMRLVKQKAGPGQCVQDAVRQAIHEGVPAWSAHSLILEGDWR